MGDYDTPCVRCGANEVVFVGYTGTGRTSGRLCMHCGKGMEGDMWTLWEAVHTILYERGYIPF